MDLVKQEVDPLHMELLRFLFERAYQPYSVFIRSWIYQAAVKDPFCEFVIEQGDFNRGSSTINARGMRNFSVQPTDLKVRFLPKYSRVCIYHLYLVLVVCLMRSVFLQRTLCSTIAQRVTPLLEYSISMHP